MHLLLWLYVAVAVAAVFDGVTISAVTANAVASAGAEHDAAFRLAFIAVADAAIASRAVVATADVAGVWPLGRRKICVFPPQANFLRFSRYHLCALLPLLLVGSLLPSLNRNLGVGA
jgi:hypothetical protein